MRRSYKAAAALAALLALILPACNQAVKIKGNKPGSDVAVSDAAVREAGDAPQPPAVPPLPAGEKPQAAFKRAVDLLGSGKPQEASVILLGLKGQMGPLVDYHLYYLARSLLMLGRPDEALGALEALRKMKGSLPGKEAAALTAEAYAQEQKYDQAAAEYEKVLKGGMADDAKKASLTLKLAQAYELAQKPLKAREHYGDIIRKLPFEKEADEALKSYARLAPGFAIPEEWRSDRVAAFEKKRMFAEALAEFDLLEVPAKKEEKDAWLFRKASLLVKARQSPAEALPILMKLITKKKGKFASQAILLAASCKRKQGEIKDARVLLQLYLKRYPESESKGEVLLDLLSLDIQESRWNFITRNYARFNKKKTFLGDDEKRQVLWALGFSNFLVGNMVKAGKIFSGLRKGGGEAMEQARADYWYAVTLMQKGKRAEAAKIFRGIHQSYPLHYYDVLSFIRLGELGEKVTLPPPPQEEKKAYTADPCALLPEKVKMLLALGFEKEARDEIREGRESIVDANEEDPDRLLRLFECSGAQEVLFQTLSGRFNKYTAFFPYEDMFIFWKILYPLARMNEVKKLSGTYGVSPYLTLSIIRQESKFDPSVTSYAGAMGIMQLMPKTAESLAKLLKKTYDRESLYSAGTNMTYGVFYLSELIDKFNGNTVLAVAAYNGGPHSVGQWLKYKWTGRLDLFVELIPFDQTRNYVRRVATSLTRYCYLYDGKIDPVVEMLSREPETGFKKEPSF